MTDAAQRFLNLTIEYSRAVETRSSELSFIPGEAGTPTGRDPQVIAAELPALLREVLASD